MLRRRALSSSSYMEDFEFNYNPNYLTIGSIQNGLQVSFGRDSYYSIDGSDEWVLLLANTQTPPIDKGHCISFKSNYVNPETDEDISIFTISKRCYLLGNCMSIIYNDDAQNNNEVPFGGLAYLFINCSNIISVTEDFLPATVLNDNCYAAMFAGCNRLKNSPRLPAAVLASKCYATMFSNCKSLKNAPELPATELAIGCYYYMFNGCTSLNYIKMLAINKKPNSLTNWVSGVSPTGTFVKNAGATWDVVGTNGVPEGWTIEYINA